MTPFRAILQRVVEDTPGAVGGAFAAYDGEMVDSFAEYDAHEWAVLTAHYGVLLTQIEALLGLMHVGGTEYFLAKHDRLDVLVHCVEGGYYMILAVARPAVMPDSLHAAREAARALKLEMA